jgi:hypothetical protein
VHVVPVFWNQRVALKPEDAEYVPFGGLMEGRRCVGRHVRGNPVCFVAALADAAAKRAVTSTALVTIAKRNVLCCRW